MLRMKATDRLFAASPSWIQPNAPGTTWLPSPTNRNSAAMVAQLVIK